MFAKITDCNNITGNKINIGKSFGHLTYTIIKYIFLEMVLLTIGTKSLGYLGINNKHVCSFYGESNFLKRKKMVKHTLSMDKL